MFDFGVYYRLNINVHKRTKMNRYLFFKTVGLIICLGIIGCRSQPFEAQPLVPLNIDEPRDVPKQFYDHIPKKISVLNSLVFSFRYYYIWRKFSSLGVCNADLNSKDKDITIVGMTPMGVKLFELTGRPDNKADCVFALEAFKKYPKFAEMVVNDSRSVYFDLLPSKKAKMELSETLLTFSEPFEKGELFYRFGGNPVYLLSKEFKEDGDVVWRVSYYQYKTIGGKLYPTGMVLDNFKYNYQLIIRLKEAM
jgi:hypothetical protein